MLCHRNLSIVRKKERGNASESVSVSVGIFSVRVNWKSFIVRLGFVSLGWVWECLCKII